MRSSGSIHARGEGVLTGRPPSSILKQHLASLFCLSKYQQQKLTCIYIYSYARKMCSQWQSLGSNCQLPTLSTGTFPVVWPAGKMI